jgi:hypothetical protein
MIPPIKGHDCGRITSFRPILKEWIKANSEIATKWLSAEDAPWWYNERASLSVFAGAIWRAGGFCFEEYSDRKREIKRQTGRLGDLYHGRVDLYFSMSRSEFVAESKYVWSCFTQNNNPAKRIRRALDHACADVRAIRPGRRRKLGIIFAMPCFKLGSKSQLDDRVQQWTDGLAGLEASAYAWVFPGCTRTLWWSEDEYFCPGAAVIIREV